MDRSVVVRRPLNRPSFQRWVNHYMEEVEDLHLELVRSLSSDVSKAEIFRDEVPFGEFAYFLYRNSSKYLDDR